jgi:predicted molibdopterin-dependent oxidoreductase YjgC
MFRRLHEPSTRLTLLVDGRAVTAAPGDSVAAALLAAGVSAFRHTARSGSARGPFCGMGVCFDCLVTVDGTPNRQACLVPVREGMRIETGGGAPALPGGAGR